MNASKRSLIILLIVAATLLAFLAGTISVTGSVPSAPEAVPLTQWSAIQAASSLLLDQGPVGTYLPVIQRY